MADHDADNRPAEAPEQADPRLIVGIAAAAHSRAALCEMLAALPPLGAYIVCLASQEALDDEVLLAELAAAAVLPVVRAEAGRFEQGHIYLVPADGLMTVARGKFRLETSREPLGARGRVDSLLVSIAEEAKERAVAVVLAGADPDGTLGVTAIKEAGGLTIAQSGPEAERAVSGGHAAAATIADYLLAPARIADCIASYAGHLASRAGVGLGDKEVTAQLARIVAVLRNRTGHDFHGYKQNTFLRRVQRRLQVTQRDTLDAYVQHLREDPHEAQRLFDDLLIGVTAFFRDPAEFEALRRDVVPKLFENKQGSDTLRLWVLGCATGEEAYSIGILLREHMATLEIAPSVQIFATDIDARSLAAARAGRYSAAVLKDMAPDRLARWFIKEGNTYVVAKELREMCIFSQHSLIKDAPFSRIDLISCRNLLIYLSAELQNRVIPLFHFALRPEGYLFLGTSENVTRHPRLFTPIDRRFRIFQRLDTTSRILPDFPFTANVDRTQPRADVPKRLAPGDGSIARRAERIAERYSPAFVVVDEHYDVLHFSGRVGRFLDPLTGAASLNLLNLVHRDLRIDLRSALQRCDAENQAVTVAHLRIETPDDTLRVALAVEPILAPAGARSFVVIFQDGERVDESTQIAPSGALVNRDEHVERLEEELRISRERLQATIEELESTNEELKSSNEEYQSINEELQSANEELETSKEELQSVNEELQTVNGELGHRVSDLARANSDLKNLLESTQIATVFLDNDLRVKMFTPALAEIFHLIDNDIDRPIRHIASRIHYPEMEADIRRVMRSLGSAEREVEDPTTGARFLARVLPYRSVDNFIAGVVLTFLDTSATARAERALRESEERFRAITNSVDLFLFISEAELDWSYVNPRFSLYTGIAEDAALGQGWLAAAHPDDIAEMQQVWHEAALAEQPFEFECRLRSADGRYRWFLYRGVPQRDGPEGALRWYGGGTDVHTRHVVEERLRLLMSELQHRVKNVLSVVRSIFRRTIATTDMLEEVAPHFLGRLDALARTQGVLVRTPDGGVDLEELVTGELLGHAAAGEDRVAVAGAQVRLRGSAAETMGLVIHELATNAMKYGALATPDGRIAVKWRIYDNGPGPRMHWEWQETGVAVVDPSPSRTGFGRELIEEGVAYQLGATTALEFLPGGIRYTIELPLTGRVVPDQDRTSSAGE